MESNHIDFAIGLNILSVMINLWLFVFFVNNRLYKYAKWNMLAVVMSVISFAMLLKKMP